MLEWSFSSSLLILLVLTVRALGKSRLSCRVRYALWLVVLARLLVPVQLIESPWDITPSVPDALTEKQFGREAVSTLELDTAGYHEHGEPLFKSDTDREVWETFSTDAPAETNTGERSLISQVLPDQATAAWYTYHWSYADILLAVWLTGMVVLALVLVVSDLRFIRRLKRGRVDYDVLCGGLRVYIAEKLASPCLVGVFRPAVYLTPESTRDEQTLRHVLAHETTHWLHGDCVWSVLRLLALCLHWYNPLVWYAVIISKRDGELACDEATLRWLGEDERIAYGETLLALVQTKPGVRGVLSASTAMTAGKRTLHERIEAIAKRPRTKAVALLLAAGVLLASTVLAFSGERGSDKPKEMRGTEQAGSSGASAAAPAQRERTGNSGGNINYGSTAAYYDDMFYYVLPGEEISEIEKGLLVKARADGSVAGVLYSGNMPRCLNAAYGWIFFTARSLDGSGCQIYKMRCDGSEMHPLLQENLPAVIRNVVVTDRMVFFLAGENGANLSLCRTPFDGGTVRRMTGVNSRAQGFVIDHGWIYCSNGGETFRIKTDGTEKEVLSAQASPFINVEDGKLYSLQPTDICKMDADGGERAMLTEGRMIPGMNVYDGWIYYYADSAVRKMRTDGTDDQSVCAYPVSRESFPGIMVLGGWLYLSGGEQGFCRVKPDGSGFQAVQKPRESDFEARFAVSGVPSKSEVLALRDRVVSGMSDDEITRLIQQVMKEDHWWEYRYFNENIFKKLDDPDGMEWNYIDQSGEIQIGWIYDGSADKDAVCAQEGLTEAAFYEKYGKKIVLRNNTQDAESFRKRILSLKESVKSGLLDRDFDRMIALYDKAKETHDVDYVIELFHMLHDMDYYVLRYGPSDIRNYVLGPNFVSNYYGCLSVWDF